MIKKWQPQIFAVLSLTSLAFATFVFAAGRSALTARGQAAVELIPQPADWVPFAADVVITHADGAESVYGRFYRDTHGCTRLETGPKGQAGVISIHNIPRSEYYAWSVRQSQWTAGPMKLPSNGWHPKPRPTSVVGLIRHPLFVEVRRGKPYNLRADQGLSAYRYLNLSATLELQIPELNFFSVLKQTLEGRRETYSNLEIGAQPEDIFQPPPGVSVASTDRLGGIVSQETATAGAHLVDMIHKPNR